jgi:hypothetical protein
VILSTFLVSRFALAALIACPALPMFFDALFAFASTSLIFLFFIMISLSIDFFASAAFAFAFSASALALSESAFIFASSANFCGDFCGDAAKCFLLSTIARSNA